MWSCSAKEEPEWQWVSEGTLGRDSQILEDKEAELGALGGGRLDKAARGGSLVREAVTGAWA